VYPKVALPRKWNKATQAAAARRKASSQAGPAKLIKSERKPPAPPGYGSGFSSHIL